MNILLVIHISSALAGLVLSGFSFLRPSRPRIQFASGLAVLTLITGTNLIWTHPAHVLQRVATGVAYLAVVLAGILAADRKLRAAGAAADRD